MSSWCNQTLTVRDYPQFCDITSLHLKYETTTVIYCWILSIYSFSTVPFWQLCENEIKMVIRTQRKWGIRFNISWKSNVCSNSDTRQRDVTKTLQGIWIMVRCIARVICGYIYYSMINNEKMDLSLILAHSKILFVHLQSCSSNVKFHIC